MNKKFLSAILFGALMVTSTGTFVSCKDYDDDIDEINKELSDIKSQLSALQTKVDGGKYVTNVVKNGDGITVTWNDNSTSTIETIKGDKGDKGDVVEITIDPTTKNWLIDGEDTGVCAEGKNGAAATDGVSAKSPSIDPATGNWVVYSWDAEKKEYVGTDTGVSAKGASAYVTESSNYYILHVATSKTGAEYTEVKLPKSPVVITEIETLGFLYTTAEKKVVYNADGTDYGWVTIANGTSKSDVWYNFSLVGDLVQAQKDWNAEAVTKKLTKGQALSTINSWNSNIVVRIAPATVDASALSFTLVNSQLKEAPIVLGTPVAYNGLLTRAVSGNGLWSMAVSAKEGLVYSNEAQYENQFTVMDEYSGNRKSIAFAFKEADGFATNYDLYFRRDANMSLTTTPYLNSVTLNEPATVRFRDPSKVYDAHLHFKEADVIRWGIQYSGNGTTFTITKMNDEQTIPSIPVTVHYVTLDGTVHSDVVDANTRKDVPVTELAAHNILIKADANKNKFEESLNKMFNELGATNTTLWKNDVDGYWVNIYRVKSGNEAIDIDVTDVYPGVSVTFDKTGSELGKASKVIVSVGDEVLDRTKQYYAVVSFYTTSDGQQYKSLNEIIVPFTVSIPALTDLLVKEQVVFGGTANGTGVLNEYDWKAYSNATYSLKYAFNKLSDAFNYGTVINFAINGGQTMKVNGSDVKVNGNLATVTNAGNGDVAVTLKDYANLKTPAYNAAINMVIASGASYLGKYPYTDAERNAAAFTLKIVSPIEQGTLIPAAGANATIKAVATEDGKAKITESDLVAKTYAGVQYNVFESKFATTSGAATANGWVSPYINGLNFKSTNENVFKMDEIVVAKRDDKNVVTPGYVVVIPMNVAYEDAVPVEVTVSDVWGYAKKATINVKVTPSVD